MTNSQAFSKADVVAAVVVAVVVVLSSGMGHGGPVCRIGDGSTVMKEFPSDFWMERTKKKSKKKCETFQGGKWQEMRSGQRLASRGRGELFRDDSWRKREIQAEAE